MVNYPNHSQVVVWPDISNYQPYINGALVRNQGYGAISYKISEGLYFIDGTAQAHHDQATSNGLIPIAYHFLANGNGAAQADRAATLVHGQNGSFNKIGFMLDVERGESTPNYGDYVAFANEWQKLGTGIPLGTYSGNWFWSGIWGNPKSLSAWNIASDYNYGGAGAKPADPWWILEVPSGGVTPGYVGAGWGGATFHARQFTDAGIVGGISPVDVNIYWGSQASFAAMVCGSNNNTNPPVCPPSGPNLFAGCPTIKLGSVDKAGFRTGASYRFSDWPVHAVQSTLNQVSNRGLAIDGSFGPTTDKAVRDFQTMFMNGVQNPAIVDGIVGTSTYGALNYVLAVKAKQLSGA